MNKTLGVLSIVRTFLLSLYVIATFVGFSYAYAYYAQFNIDFLNFATALDFIFVSLANIGTLPTIIPFVLFVFSLLAVSIGLSTFVVVLIVRGFLRSSASLLFWAIVAAMVIVVHAISATMLYLLSTIVFVLSAAVAPVRNTLVAVYIMVRARLASGSAPHDGTHGGEGEDIGGAKEQQTPSFGQAYASVANQYAVYFSPRESVWTKGLVDRVMETLRSRPGRVAELWRASWSWLRKTAERTWASIPGSRTWHLALISVFVVIAIGAAMRTGVVDARCVIENERDCQLEMSNSGSYSYFLRWFNLLPDAATSGTGGVAFTPIIVPSSNLASMRSLGDVDCSCDKGGGRKHGSCVSGKEGYSCPRKHFLVNVRQGSASDDTSGLACRLAYIGAVEHAHFFLRLDADPSPPSVDGPEPVNGAPPTGSNTASDGSGDPPPAPPSRGGVPEDCGSWNGAQEPGGPEDGGSNVDAGTAATSDRACKREFVAAVGPFLRGSDELDERDSLGCTTSRGLTDFEGLRKRVGDRVGSGRTVREVLIVGHVDSRPINTGVFRSNVALAQARAERTYCSLKNEEWMVGAHVVRLPAGPRSPGRPHDDCDRNVEVHMCFTQEVRKHSKADAVAPDCEGTSLS